MSDMEIHARLEEYKASIYDLIVKSEVEEPELLEDKELEVLAHLVNNINFRLSEIDDHDTKIVYLRNLIVTLTATNMIITKKVMGGLDE